MLGCAANATAPKAAAGTSTPEANQADEILGTVAGVSVRRADLAAERLAEMKTAENEALQRQWTSIFLAVDDVINDVLLKKEAEKRGISVESLYEQEVVSKTSEPSNDEVEKIYEANRDQIPVPLTEAAPYIKRQLAMQRATETLRAYVDTLKATSDVRYNIPTPVLPRFKVEPGDNPSVGPADARVTIVEFSDFECPYCSRAAKTLEKLKTLYPQDVRLVFRDFPLSQHTKARKAALAAFCAHEQNKFWSFHDELFANAPALGDEELTKYAAGAGLDAAAMTACLASDRPEAAVAADEKAGRELALDGTPGIFVNGMKLLGVLPLPLMQAIIDKELGR